MVEDEMTNADRETVVLTGFGPFQHHPINASWEVVKAVQDLNIEEELGIKLITEQIDVAYATVTKVIPELWQEYKPRLMIHLGVSGIADRIILECQARKEGYSRRDVFNDLPSEGKCSLGECPDIHTQLDLKKVINDLTTSSSPVKVCSSRDAGRYLCEFIYYTSLSIDSQRTVFVHVPDIDQPYSVKEMAEGMKVIINSLLDQIRRKDASCKCLQENMV